MTKNLIILITLLTTTACVKQQATKPHNELAISESAHGVHMMQAQVGQIHQFAESPWGKNIQLNILEKYDSALGEKCIKVILTSTTKSEQKLLCSKDQQMWRQVKNFE